MTVIKPYTFTSGEILSDEVNANFDELYDALNNDYIDKSAALAFENIPSGPAADPTSANQLVRKAYVDKPYVAATWNFSADSASTAWTSVSTTVVSSRGLTATTTSTTISSAGVYLVTFSGWWDTHASGSRWWAVTRNATLPTANNTIVGHSLHGDAVSAGLGHQMSAAAVVSLSQGDVLRNYYRQNAGVALDTGGSFGIVKIS